jgi:hypothetical protein
MNDTSPSITLLGEEPYFHIQSDFIEDLPFVDQEIEQQHAARISCP